MSNLKYEEIEYDGIKFATTQYGAMRGLELLGKLARTIGPAMGALGQMEWGPGDIEKAAPILGYALQNLQPNELTSLVTDILKGTTATLTENGTLRRVDLLDGNAIDRVFNGRLLTMFKVILNALRVNFADFGFGSAAQKESAPATE